MTTCHMLQDMPLVLGLMDQMTKQETQEQPHASCCPHWLHSAFSFLTNMSQSGSFCKNTKNLWHAWCRLVVDYVAERDQALDRGIITTDPMMLNNIADRYEPKRFSHCTHSAAWS